MAAISLNPDSDARAGAVSRQSTACTHCGLPVPVAMHRADEATQFCCHGCAAVYDAIQNHGLGDYYSFREVSQTPVDADAARRFEDFDADSFRERYCHTTSDGLSTVELALGGVHCAACVWLVEKTSHIVPGVIETHLNLRRGLVRIVWDDSVVALSAIARQLGSFGYVPRAMSAHAVQSMRRDEDRRFLIRCAASGAIAGNVMLIAFALYGGMFHGMEAGHANLFRWTSLVLTVISLVWPGRLFFTSAWHAIRTRTAHMDIPIAIGLTAGSIWSIVATIRGTDDVYFDAVTVLIFLLLVGRWIQIRQQRESTHAVEMLFSMTPRHVRVIDDGLETERGVETLVAGEQVIIDAGETIPADGVVAEGTSTLDLAWLTGESEPSPAAPGTPVYAGSTNQAARLIVTVERTGDTTRAGRLMRLVEEHAQRRAPLVRLADRIAGVFAIVVLALAAITVLVWWPFDPSHGVRNAMALLIITCPCALGLATPLAVVAAVGRAAGRGILIKGGDVIEAVSSKHGTAFLDKTGTITEGSMTVHEWHGDAALRPLVAAVESTSRHPIAVALAAGHDATVNIESTEFMNDGVRSVAGGRALLVGSKSCMERSDVVIPEWARRVASDAGDDMRTSVFVAEGNVVRAVASIGDRLRPDAADSIARLTQFGWRVAILSGDRPDIVARIGRHAGIDEEDCHGGLSPEEKLRRVEAAKVDGPVMMVGDGVNDAAALTAATIGVAVHGGAEASLLSSDVYLSRDGLGALPEIIEGSVRTIHVIRRGLAVSLGYNVVGSTLAIAGFINPVVAAILMPLSSLTVITLALRARTFGGSECQ